MVEADDTGEEPSAAAIRMRRYRERRKEGYRVFTISIPDTFVDELVETHRLDPDQRDDNDEVVAAIEALLADAIGREPKLGRCEFDLNPKQIQVLIRRRHLDPKAQNSENHVRAAFADFVRRVFERLK